jgi:tetratricopeptide (TPR) repeat protein
VKYTLKYLLLFFLFVFYAKAQNQENIATCFKKLQTPLHDTTRIRIYLELANEYASFYNDSTLHYSFRAQDLLVHNPNLNQEAYAKYLEGLVYYVSSEFEKSQHFVNEALMLTKGTNEKLLMAKCYNLLGAIQFNLGNYAAALREYNNKLEVVNARHDTFSIVETHYNMSLINNAEGSYYESLEHNYTGLALSEKIKDTIGILVACEGLGISYTKIGDSENAIQFLKKALQLAILKNRPYEHSGILVDLGEIYLSIKQLDLANYYYGQAEEIASRNGDKLTKALAISGKGEILFDQGKPREAKQFFNDAIGVYKEITYIKGEAENKIHLAECNQALGNFKKAKGQALDALFILKKLKEKQTEKRAYKILSEAYEKLNNTDSAFLCYKKYILIADSLQARSSFKKISEYESNLEKKKIEQERIFAEKTTRAELVRQKQIRNTVLGLSLVILLMLILVNRNYKLKQKANIEISKQKKIIEHKNKDIVDSINYSRRLQEAVLTTPNEIRKMLPASFIIYKPKGHVSSDFYFVENAHGNRKVHVVVGSCTGQGVPGAFISIIAHNILKQALKEPGLETPSQVLDFLDAELKKFLRSDDKNSSITDGIDVAYCILDFKRKELQYTGANCPAWLSVSESINNRVLELVSIRGSRQLYRIEPVSRSVGFSGNEEKFKTECFQLKENDAIFLYAGFETGFLAKGSLHEKIIHRLNMPTGPDFETLHADLLDDITGYNGEKESADDICIIGVKI